MPATNVIQLRKGTSAEWASANPILANGEPGFDTTNSILKVGDGSSTWDLLPAIGPAANKILSDVSGSTNYIGIAPSGSATSATVWTIYRTIYNSGGSVTSDLSAVNVAWDNRYTETYS